MRPFSRFLADDLVERIIAEARDLLAATGTLVEHPEARALLADHGARIDPVSGRARLAADLIDKALQSAPSSFALFDSRGERVLEFAGQRVHFTPGSAAVQVLDSATGKARSPHTDDYVRYARLVSRLPHMATQSTAFVPADVPAPVSDSYRLVLSLLNCRKPVVTGAFSGAGMDLMRDLLLIVRGGEQELRERPCAVFSCCPSPPLRWAEGAVHCLLLCARHGIPVEYVSMPLAGFTAPVTPVGALVLHTAENLSGLVISQLARPGAPALYGSAASIFDMRHETTPLGALESALMNAAQAEIGRRLGLPTQAYLGLSDAKLLDGQAGMETALGSVLATLAGVDQVAGAGMLEFVNCFSSEKLVLDHELCAMLDGLQRGIEIREDLPIREHVEELLREGHLLISDHTLRHARQAVCTPGRVIDRQTRARWEKLGEPDLAARARAEVEALSAPPEVPALRESVGRDLLERMTAAAHAAGLPSLPFSE